MEERDCLKTHKTDEVEETSGEFTIENIRWVPVHNSFTGIIRRNDKSLVRGREEGF